MTIESLRKQIGKVTQETVLFNDTVRNNIAYGRPDVPLARVEEAARMALAHDFIERMPEGYDTVIGEKGARLSGGETAADRDRARDPEERADTGVWMRRRLRSTWRAKSMCRRRWRT